MWFYPDRLLSYPPTGCSISQVTMESFIIPNKNKSHSLTMQEQMTAKPSPQLPSAPIKNSWPWDSRVTKNPAFTTMNLMPQRKGEKFSTLITSLSTVGPVSPFQPTLIPNIWPHSPIKTLMDKQFWHFGILKEENARLKLRFKEENKKIFPKFYLTPIHKTLLSQSWEKRPLSFMSWNKIFSRKTFL